MITQQNIEKWFKFKITLDMRKKKERGEIKEKDGRDEEKEEREEKKYDKRWREEVSNSSSLAKGSYLIRVFCKDPCCRHIGHLNFVKTCPTLPLSCFVDYATPNLSVYYLISPL